jgi:hypothetical protein
MPRFPLIPCPARSAVAALAILLGLGASAPEIQAQDIQVRVMPSAGWFHPTSALYETDFSPGLVNPARAELEGTPILGLGLHAVPAGALISFRLAVERTVSLEARVVGRDPLVGAPPEQWPEHHFTVPASVTMVTGDLLLHPDRREFRMDPYLFVGVGWKSYSFGDPEPEDEVGFDFPEDASGGRIHYGAGMELRLARVPLSAEIGGNYNRFVLVDDEQGISKSRAQHEFHFTLRAFIRGFSF